MTETPNTQQPQGYPIAVAVTRSEDGSTVTASFGLERASVVVSWPADASYAEWKALDSLLSRMPDALIAGLRLEEQPNG